MNKIDVKVLDTPKVTKIIFVKHNNSQLVIILHLRAHATTGIDFIITTSRVPVASNGQAQAAKHLVMHRTASNVKNCTQNFNSTKD